jgi:pimeloyl-ACP methyl ester carboxylesterase
MSVMRLAVDGKDIGSLSDYRTATPLFTLWLPPGNELGSDKPVADAVADGYQVMLKPLAEGDHVVEMSSPGPNGGEAITVTYTLSITSGAYGETSATPAEATPEGSPQASGSVVDTHIDVGGGRMLHVRCAGTGSPTIVYEAGGPSDIGTSSLIGTPLGADLAGVSRFCAYDRAWQTSSDPAPAGSRTFRDSAADLHTLLSSPELDCPCVLIGESMGGAISLILATMHLEDIAGLVLLDPPPPGLIDQVLKIAPAGSPEADLANGFPPDPEHFDFLASLRQVETPNLPATVPVEVLTHGQGDPPPCFPCSSDFPADQLEVWWQHAQAELATALNGKLVVAEDSSHFISTDQPDLIVAATREVVSAVQDPTNWPPTPSPAA